jgi:hypothetical protein
MILYQYIPDILVSKTKKYVRYMMISIFVCTTALYIILDWIAPQHKQIAVYIDASLSMMTKDMWWYSRFDIARKSIKDINKVLAPYVSYDIYLFGSLPVLIAQDVWSHDLNGIVDAIDPHRITLVDQFLGSSVNNLMFYHHYTNQNIWLVITDGYQTTGFKNITWSYDMVIVWIGSSGHLLWYDLWSRPVITSLDSPWLEYIAHMTNSSLELLSDSSKIAIAVEHIVNHIDRIFLYNTTSFIQSIMWYSSLWSGIFICMIMFYSLLLTRSDHQKKQLFWNHTKL